MPQTDVIPLLKCKTTVCLSVAADSAISFDLSGLIIAVGDRRLAGGFK